MFTSYTEFERRRAPRKRAKRLAPSPPRRDNERCEHDTQVGARGGDVPDTINNGRV